MLLFWDTETSGLPDFRAPSDAPQQPHLVQLACLLCEDNGDVKERWQTLVQPGAGASMHPKAFEAHGISLERARDEGIDAAVAVDAMMDMAGRATAMVGHNISFDVRIMRITTTRTHRFKWEPRIPTQCTMRMATPIINLPPTPKSVAAGFNKPKAPNLGECVRFFFDEELDGAHDALVDVDACKRVYFEIQERKLAE
ncbi:MAG: 3'-5' exonuclease [Shewanella sp.]